MFPQKLFRPLVHKVRRSPGIRAVLILLPLLALLQAARGRHGLGLKYGSRIFVAGGQDSLEDGPEWNGIHNVGINTGRVRGEQAVSGFGAEQGSGLTAERDGAAADSVGSDAGTKLEAGMDALHAVSKPVMREQRPASQDEEGCLSMVFYDKPMKTGSSALRKAAAKLLTQQGEEFSSHAIRSGSMHAERMCLGEVPLTHMINHIHVNLTTARCLRQMGFYSVTSIRDPRERWVSAYRYLQGSQAGHYGISYNATFEEFVSKIPNCTLLRYYDVGNARCQGGVEEPEFKRRVEAILSRFDEIIDLYGETRTELHSRLMPFLTEENSSGKRFNVDMPEDAYISEKYIQYEQVLYDALQRRRTELMGSTERRLCAKLRIVESL